MGGKEINYTGSKKGAIEGLNDLAFIYGWADLLEDGIEIYTCLSNNKQTKLIKHKNK
jgi:hypothetical protein